MTADENLEIIHRLVTAYAAADIEEIDRLLAADVVFHIPGRHPLAKTYVGKDEAFSYLARVAALSESEDGGFAVHSVTADDEHAIALVTGTIEHHGVRFVRPTVHVFHVNGSHVTEFWEASLDQHAEDQFWIDACEDP
jgi:ketosteroid isomerase-like protein